MARPHSPDSMRSPSPAAAHQPLTKRDVRRNRIMERLQSMISTFSSQQQAHYRAQLQAIQVDMTLISRADPYPGMPLEADGDELEERVKELIGGEEGLRSIAGAGENIEDVIRDFWALAGKRYGDFVRQVNDSVEGRDSDLTALHNNYASSLAELDLLTQQKLHQAQEEHAHLSGTIRQRLIASLTKKRNQLLKDKENLDIGDANALLMHPRHFSLNTNSLDAPGSPGGPGTRQDRKTRHLRHRAGSPAAGENGFGEIGKRKRKAGPFDDDGNESPAPGFRLPLSDNLGGGRSPFRDARDKQIHAQFEAPAYSLERIFTDKELAMATDTARTATWRRFFQPEVPKKKEQEDPTTRTGGALSNTAANGSTDALAEGEPGQAATETIEGTEEANAAPTIENGNATPPLSQPTAAVPAAAPEMERTSSHQVLTRGGARANPLAALSDLASVAAIHGQRRETEHQQMLLPFAPVVPNHHAVARTEKNGAPAPAAVSSYLADNDWAEMTRGDAGVDNNSGLDAELDRRDDQGDIAMENGIDNGTTGYSLAAEGAIVPESPRSTRRRLLDQALSNSYGLVSGASASSPFRLPLTDSGAAVVDRKGVDRLPGTGFAPLNVYHEQRARMQASLAAGATGSAATPPAAALAQTLRARGGGLGGEPMSRNTSTGGLSDIGDGTTSGNGRARRTRGI
ncbi:hypothetical protein K431DRAFT_296777 [Polychaeton citri CBS 116435]|uniref:Uncharacterized protein n=1 Tax=Polychaeton citri CBS 116435 TaxID=1314669 RepID=A0A9P4ULL5_9PEZI|nr:hypothetical protein K431DRAFT_296777 [Polychaeton citri CBS 116435]